MPYELLFGVSYLPVSRWMSDVQTKRFYVYKNGVPKSTRKETCAQTNERNVVRTVVVTLRKMTDRSSLRIRALCSSSRNVGLGSSFEFSGSRTQDPGQIRSEKRDNDFWPHCRPGHVTVDKNFTGILYISVR